MGTYNVALYLVSFVKAEEPMANGEIIFDTISVKCYMGICNSLYINNLYVKR